MAASDSQGNVWYMGEDTKTLKNGKVTSREGSFEAGVHAAKGGIVMQADPKAGMSYRQERYPGHAEDQAKVLALDSQAEDLTASRARLVQAQDAERPVGIHGVS